MRPGGKSNGESPFFEKQKPILSFEERVGNVAPHNRYRDGAAPPGFFWLFANGELVGDKPCAIARRCILVGEW